MNPELALEYTMIAGDVAALYGVSVRRIHQLDDQLQPKRHTNGSRRYSPKIVAAVLKERAR